MKLSRFEEFQHKRIHSKYPCAACKIQRCVPLKDDPVCQLCEQEDYEEMQKLELPKGVDE